MDAKLVVVGGKANKSLVSVKLPTVIGRSRQADLTVAHPMVSRKHCELYEADGLLMIRDLGSLNGTVVEGQRIEESPLCPGNEFTLGPLSFRAEYEYEGDLDSVPAPKTVDNDPSQPQIQSDDEAPASEAPVSESVDETPLSPQTDAPAGGQLPEPNAWGQRATDAVGEPQQQEAVVEIEELTEVKDEEDEEAEPTPPPPSRLEQPPAGDPSKSPPAGADNLDEFLKGLP